MSLKIKLKITMMITKEKLKTEFLTDRKFFFTVDFRKHCSFPYSVEIFHDLTERKHYASLLRFELPIWVLELWEH